MLEELPRVVEAVQMQSNVGETAQTKEAFLQKAKDIDPKLHTYLSEILRVMDNGALLIMSTPNITSLISRIRMVLGQLPVAVSSDPTHVRFYRKKDIKILFRKFNLHTNFIPTSISLNPLNPKSRFRIPSLQIISSLDDSLVFYTHATDS